MTPQDARELLASHSRAKITLKGESWWLQPVFQDGPNFHCLISDAKGTRILEIESSDLAVYALSGEVVEVEPLIFKVGKIVATSTRGGHNGIAAAILIMSWYSQPAKFFYQKPKTTGPEGRHVRLKWALGEKFGGEDYARGMAGRAFRLDRTSMAGLSAEATVCPVFTEGEYRSGAV